MEPHTEAQAPPAKTETPAEPKSTGAVAHLRGLVGTLLLAALIFILIWSTFQNFRVEGPSMEPAVEDGTFLLVNKAAYMRLDVPRWAEWIPFLDRDGDGAAMPFGSPRRGDVIVFKHPQQTGRNLIKRVIGLPGETAEVRSGVVYINGKELDENYIPRLSARSLAPETVPEGHYFVMGDNRPESNDSRDPNVSFIPRENIIGKAWFSYWPKRDVGWVRAKTPEPGDAG